MLLIVQYFSSESIPQSSSISEDFTLLQNLVANQTKHHWGFIRPFRCFWVERCYQVSFLAGLKTSSDILYSLFYMPGRMRPRRLLRYCELFPRDTHWSIRCRLLGR